MGDGGGDFRHVKCSGILISAPPLTELSVAANWSLYIHANDNDQDETPAVCLDVRLAVQIWAAAASHCERSITRFVGKQKSHSGRTAVHRPERSSCPAHHASSRSRYLTHGPHLSSSLHITATPTYRLPRLVCLFNPPITHQGRDTGQEYIFTDAQKGLGTGRGHYR